MERKQKSHHKFCVSIKRVKNCIFSRRYGYEGKLFLGYSIIVRAIWI